MFIPNIFLSRYAIMYDTNNAMTKHVYLTRTNYNRIELEFEFQYYFLKEYESASHY